MSRPRRRLWRYDYTIPTEKGIRALLAVITAFGKDHKSWTSPDGMCVHHDLILDMDAPDRARLFAAINTLKGFPWAKMVPPWATTRGPQP